MEASEEKKKRKMQGLKATMMMIATQLATAGITIFYKLAANDGMHITILIAYRYLFASLIIFPLALFIERNKRPKLTWKIFFQAFVCAIIGLPMVQLLYAESLVLTSATYAAAISNLAPPFTFVIGVLFGTEKVKIGTKGGKAKVVGTLVGVVGAMVLTFYKGRQLNIWSTHYNVLHGDGHVASTHKTSTHHLIGSLSALGSCLSIALYLTLQVKLSAVYPCHYTNTFLITAMGCILSLVFALCVERSWSQWKLGWNIRLLAVFFMGIGSTLTILFLTTAIHLQGPLFAANFSPLSLVFVAIGGSLLLDENLHVGSVLGAVIIIVGLYILLWGKSNMMRMSKQMPTTSSKDGNEALTINAAMTALDTVHVARTSLSTTNEDNEMPLSTREKQEEQKVTKK
ncbi:WAT1-related protein At1g25270-like [Cynara cardunculus var. scolymus]|uniref:WAT1-related protein At1g25270-like n=1 Tax=Cynara cardunculus var. scolymus TaxID=59895 RepID=UPI000D62F00F|nr:WAT1-related protein At1g25270-like [Cynara cardunculus var. scolymus]